MKLRSKRYILVLAIMYLLCAGYFFVMSWHHKSESNKYQKEIEKVYANIENVGEKFVFEGDSLVYWQTNTIPIDSNILKDSKTIELKNGLYLKKNTKKGNKNIVWLYLIKSNYPVNNKYLNNSYNKPFEICNSKHFSEKELFFLHIFISLCIFCTGIFLISLIKRRPKNRNISFALIVPIYIMYGFLVYRLCSFFDGISLNLYSNEIKYSNILYSIVMLGVGFWIYLLTIKLFRIHKKSKYFIVNKLLIVLVLSIVCGSTMEIFSYLKIKEGMENKAKSLSVHRNPETEALFVNKILDLESDDEFAKLIENKEYSNAEKFITDTYFTDLSENYHIGALVFNDKDSMEVQPGNYFVNILSYTEERIEAARRIDSAMVWVEDSEIDDNGTYIYLCKSDDANIFVECLKKKNSKNMNYSLLLSPDDEELNEHISYARYYRGDLIYSVGNRNYTLTKQGKHNGWENEAKYISYFYNNNNNLYVVSLQYRLPYNILGAISLFFLCFIVLLAIEYLLKKFPKADNMTPSIRSSILIALISTFIVGTIIAGFFSIRNIRSFNTTNNTDILKEKTASIRLDLERYFSENTDENLDNILLDLSNSFMTDINVFDTNGILISTSQKDIFERGYISNRINNEAKQKLRNKSSNIIYMQEKIGKREFMASYCPVNDQSGKTICYLNIPFISQQKAMDDNINNMINNFVNMFLFWINISVILFLFLSNYIVKPIRTLKERLNKVKVDGKNEKILWENEDEIGELIESYNVMVDKIEESSLLLKQQERQASWRELAKQVAHDIKNPLTPMKLSIQYLQKLHDKKPEMFDDKFNEIAPSLISQIEGISNIASELNNYSKPMTLQKEKTDLNKCIKDAINLFNSADDVIISYNKSVEEDCFVCGDEKLFVRILNNMLKNSCQAFYDKEEGHIDIGLTKEEDQYIISIKDDGCGIKEENKDKIFTHHFSTKTEGSGIGLTIVKTIIESYDGSISFVSKENEGTTFFIKFNAFEENSLEK